VIRRIRLAWPTPPLDGDGRREVRLLAVSDERVKALSHERNRTAIAPVDAILGCGDLEPDYLAFLADAFRAPLLYVRGNHDRGGAWESGRQIVPVALAERIEVAAGIPIGGLPWPTAGTERADRDEESAWLQALRLYIRARLRGPSPQIVISHVPPRGSGDIPADPYHTGFAGYRWLCRRLQPRLWLHGHTTIAAAEHWRTELGSTTLINVTGAALIQLEA
jgi:uncharacterized protein